MTELGTESIRIAVDDAGIAMLTIDVPGQAANTMSVGFKAELREVVPRLRAARERLKGVVITSAKKTFFAGGDLRSLIAVQPQDADGFYEGLEAFKVALRGLEKLEMPVAVAINGAALGGGWEICLCAHARFCLADDKLLLGLPEATLGLLPGAGGVSRMVRHLGLRRALPLLVGGKTFSPRQAHAWGLLQGVADDMPSVIAAARDWVLAHPRPVVAWDQPDFAIPAINADLAYIAAHGAAELYADGNGQYPARRAIFANAVEGALVDIDTALRLETRYLTSLATGQVAKNMINTFFFQSNQIKSGKGRPSEAARLPEKALELGDASPAGQMAALASASRRVPAIVRVPSEIAREQAQRSLDDTVKALVAKGRLSASKAASVRSAVSVVLESDAPAAAGALLIASADQAGDRDSVVLLSGEPCASSVLPRGHVGIRAIPDLFGASVVEVVLGDASDGALATRVYDYLQQLGKTPIVVSDADRGFLQRVGGAAGEEGLAMCREGLTPAFVEAVTLQTDMQSSALALASCFCAPGAPSIQAPAAALDSPALVREVQDRILFVQALEALRCLEEGVVKTVVDANIASVQGLGFPSWTGGVIQYVNQYGLAKFVSRAMALADKCGERFAPPQILRKLVDAGARAVEV